MKPASTVFTATLPVERQPTPNQRGAPRCDERNPTVRRRLLPLALIVLAALANCAPANNPLPSWNDGSSRTAITDWLAAVTDPASTDFIPVADRLAVFDNDGACWCERPQYPSTLFQIELARSLAAAGRIDGDEMPWRAWFADDRDALRTYGMGDAYGAFIEAFAGMGVEAYADSSSAFIARERHPRFGVPLTDLYYQPMIELKDLLEAHDFEVWIVTAAEQDFVRSFITEAFGIPLDRLLGSWVTPVYNEAPGGGVELVRSNRQTSNGNIHKPENIFARMGRRPVFSAGNSDNDEPMNRYAVTGPHRGLAIWVHHDDAEREYAYDRGTEDIAELCRTHPAAHEVSMKQAWGKIFTGATP